MKPLIQKKHDHTGGDDEINFQQHLSEMKKILFKLFSYYNKKISQIPIILIYLLNFVEFLQVLYFIVNPQLKLYPQNSVIVQKFTTVLSYLNTTHIIKYNDASNNFILVMLTFAFIIFTVFLLYYSYLKIVKKEQFLDLKVKRSSNGGYSNDLQSVGKSRTEAAFLNLAVFNLLMIHTIFTIPMYNILFPTFYCTQENGYKYSIDSEINNVKCYDATHIVAILFALFSIIMLMMIKFFCLSLFYERNPFKKSLYACDDNMGLLFLRGIVIAIVWYYIVDYNYKLKPLFLGVLVLIFGWFLFMFRWQQIGFYSKRYMSFTLVLEILLLCFSLNNLVQYFLPSDTDRGIYLIQFLFSSVVLGFGVSQAMQFEKSSLIDKYYINPDSIKKGKNVEMFWIELISYIYHEPDYNKRRINLKMLLKQLDKSVGSKLSEAHPQFLTTIQKMLLSKQTRTQRQQQMIILQYLRIIVEELIEIKPCIMFQGSRCGILFQEGYKTKALCQVYKLSGQKLSWIDEFFLQQIKQRNCFTSEEENDEGSVMSTLPLKESNNMELDEQKIVVYEQYISLISMLQAKITKCLSINMQFWSQLLQEEPDFEYSKKLADKLLLYHQQITLYHQSIHSLFQNSIKAKFLYFSYLQTLQWSQQHTEDILEFLQQNQYNLRQKNSQKLVFNNVDPNNFNINFNENEKIVMIQLDFTNHDGYIRNTNSEIFNFLGYAKSELIGRKIDKILPSLIASKHSKFVHNFMNRKESISKSSERIVCGVHKSKYLQPGFLNIKVIYSQEDGMKLIAFIRPLNHDQRTFGILTTEQSSMILGITKDISLKIRDKQFLSEMLNQSVYLQVLFPKLKIQKLQPNKTYETEMTTFNNLQKQQLAEKNVMVSLKYDQNHYQENLSFRYYFVKYLKKSELSKQTQPQSPQTHLQQQPTLTNYSMSLPSEKSSNNLQTNQSMMTQMNTTKLLQTFNVHREDSKRGKIEQLDRFKVNYLNKYNESKYYVCLFMFLMVFAAAVGLCSAVFYFGEEFGQDVKLIKQKMIQLSTLTRHVSILQTKWIKIYMIDDPLSLQAAKTQYTQLSSRFQNDLTKFISYTTVSHQHSLFNIKIFNQHQEHHLRETFNFQSSSLTFNQLGLLSSLSPTEMQYFETLRNQMLKQTSNILKVYIDDELALNLKMNMIFSQVQETKFYYNLGIIGMQVLFLFLSWLSIMGMRQYVEKNMEILHFLTLHQIHSITKSISQFLKTFLSSQLESESMLNIENGDKKSLNSLRKMNENQNNNKLNNSEKQAGQEQHSLHNLLQKKDFSNGIALNNKIIQKIQFEALQPMSDKKDKRSKSKSNKRTESSQKQKGSERNSRVKKRQSEKLSPILHELVQADAKKNARQSRSGTAISKVSFQDLDQKTTKNNLSVLQSEDSLQISEEVNKRNEKQVGNQLNLGANIKKGAKSNRRSSFRKNKESIGMELITSAIDAKSQSGEQSNENYRQNNNNNQMLQIHQRAVNKRVSNNNMLFNAEGESSITLNQIVSNKPIKNNVGFHSRKNSNGQSVAQDQPLLKKDSKIQRKARNRLQSLRLQTIEMQYPSRLWRIICCVILVGLFAGMKQSLYAMQQSEENGLILYGLNMNNLVKIDNKLMYLRSFIMPYYMSMTDPKGHPIITKQTLFEEVANLQSYMSLIYNQLLSRQEILKEIYRDITFYIYLLQTYQPDSDYIKDIKANAPQQLSEGIQRVLDNFLSRHDDLVQQIQKINSQITKTDSSIHIYYILEITLSVVMLMIILMVQYYLLIWRLKDDQQATFNMVRFIPLKIVTSNRNILKTIKKQSAKQ